MHEMGIAMQVVEIVLSSIPADLENPRVETVNLKVGKLAAVVPESLRFCFEIITKETPLAEAELNIEEVPVKARCRDCQHEWTIQEAVFMCESCSGGSIELISGRELEIASIELED
jgi:hydrogenase nickel incorporation protein HypA/HybF